MKVKLNRRGMLFKIIRVVTSKLIRGEYHFSNVTEISSEELQQHMASSAPPLLIDVRDANEYNSGFGHLPGARHLPLMELVVKFPSAERFKEAIKGLEAQLMELEPYMEGEVVTICPGGGFSLVAAEIMAEAGFKNVKSLAGGADGWFKDGYPTELGEDKVAQ
ncbi:MAG: rhodanese-like domain-containing protein [Anaerolineales bacterium]|nr:MAG: rhodanese-like domain-containing protein [Anaerolineales bacterium]